LLSRTEEGNHEFPNGTNLERQKAFQEKKMGRVMTLS
jgi:hypothetical protein